MNKKNIGLICLAIFVVSFFIYYLPYRHKGEVHAILPESLILARNLSMDKGYSLDSQKNVFLSSERVSLHGIESRLGNKLTAYLYSWVFDVFGFHPDLPIYVSFLIYSLVNVILFLLVLKMFGARVALLFAPIAMLLPIAVSSATWPGYYEWAILFLTLGIFLYFFREKPSLYLLGFSGLFFGLAGLSYNAALLSFAGFALFELVRHRSIKRVAIFGLPAICLFVLFVLPANTYLARGTQEETTNAYMHVFPDPYTWHFERESFVASIKGATDYDYNQFLTKYGYQISFKNRIWMYASSIISYPKGLISTTSFGGPIIVLLAAIGLLYLYKDKEKKYLFWLFISWAGVWYFLLVILKSNHWGHFVDFILPVGLLAALALRRIFDKFNLNAWQTILVMLFVVAELGVANKWTFHEDYLNSVYGRGLAVVEKINARPVKLDKKIDVIATGEFRDTPQIINYYTDISAVYFDPATIKKLLAEGKLKWAFEQFGVTIVGGYEKDLTREISEATGLPAI